MFYSSPFFFFLSSSFLFSCYCFRFFVTDARLLDGATLDAEPTYGAVDIAREVDGIEQIPPEQVDNFEVQIH